MYYILSLLSLDELARIPSAIPIYEFTKADVFFKSPAVSLTVSCDLKVAEASNHTDPLINTSRSGDAPNEIHSRYPSIFSPYTQISGFGLR